jgi:hypothetical protein
MKLSRSNTLMLATGVFGLMGMPKHINGEDFLRSSVKQDQHRRLASSKRCFAGVTGMSTAEAVSALQADLVDHPFPVEIIVHKALTVEEKTSLDSYFEVGIPVNLAGEARCDIKGGIVRGPATWEVSNGVFEDLPKVDCTGLFIIGCCDKYMTAVKDLGIPLTDVHGKCLSCWASQEHLEPFMSDTNEMTYVDMEYVGGVCQETELTLAYVQGEDIATQTFIDDLIANEIRTMIDNPTYATCSELKKLKQDLIENARALPVAMTKISSMLCGFCEPAPGNTDRPSDTEVSTLLTELVIFLQRQPVKSDRNVLVVYTDSNGNVLQPPTIGGRGNGDAGSRRRLEHKGAKCTEEELAFGEERLGLARGQWRANARAQAKLNNGNNGNGN